MRHGEVHFDFLLNPREVTFQDVKEVAKLIGAKAILETSAKENKGVNEVSPDLNNLVI